MFTQFFGNYLLNKGIVSAEKLSEALSAQKNVRLKLGVLAINAGLMTAEQVDAVHNEQQRVDKRIGDLMVEMGYVTREQVEELFKTQPSGHLLLGQALVDSGTMTNAQFEAALQDYKAENGISDADFNSANDEKTESILSGIYNLKGEPMEKYISGYISLLFKNIIRFIGDDFTPVSSGNILADNCVYQKMKGIFSMNCAIIADNTANIGFGSRFSNEELTENDDYTNACVSEFLNLHNGLFAVNLSNETGKELQLEPQENTVPDFSEYSTICEIPVCFSFGLVDFVIAF
ncbi:MAG: chemotaxis protein CheX [Oscillospiraceae bacterium]